MSGNSAGSEDETSPPSKFHEIHTSRIWGALIFVATFVVLGSSAAAISWAFPNSGTNIFIQKNFDTILGVSVGIVALGVVVSGFVPRSDR